MQLQDNECSGKHLVKILAMKYSPVIFKRHDFGAIVDNISAAKIEILFLLISLFIES